jgi:hypothetical protein
VTLAPNAAKDPRGGNGETRAPPPTDGNGAGAAIGTPDFGRW